MRRRIGRPSLLGTAARTAVVAGTASATINAVNRKKGAPEPEQTAPAPVAAPAPVHASGLTDDTIAKLRQLGELHTSGVLTDQEFAAAKAKLLA